MDFPRLLDILLRLVVELPLDLDGFGAPFALRGGRLEVDLARAERMNSFIRRVGVPSRRECSPLKPEEEEGKTITIDQTFGRPRG
jgi:hypothetical protein